MNVKVGGPLASRKCKQCGKPTQQKRHRFCGMPCWYKWQHANRSHDNRLFGCWRQMHYRCYRPEIKAYAHYGGRGIRVCAAWHNWHIFQQWAESHGYIRGLTLERRNVNGNYEPGNCCYIPKSAQSRNTRRNLYVTAWGETKILRDWADDPRCKVGYDTLYSRVRRPSKRNPLSIEDAIRLPVCEMGEWFSHRGTPKGSIHISKI